MEDAVTTDYINKEIKAAEKALEVNEQRSLRNSGDVNDATNESSPLTRLRHLETESEDLILAKEVAGIRKESENDDRKRLGALGDLLCRHQARPRL